MKKHLIATTSFSLLCSFSIGSGFAAESGGQSAEDVIISVSAFPEIRSRIASTVQVIDQATIRRSSGQSITDLLTEASVGYPSDASQGNGPNTIGAQLRRGEPADMVIMNRAGLNDLIAEGKIAAGTQVDLAGTLIAVAELQDPSVFSASVVAGAKDVESAKRLIAFLES